MAPPEKSLHLFYEIEKLLKEEEQCISDVRYAETEISLFIKRRTSEYLSPNLTTSSFDRNRIETEKSIKVFPRISLIVYYSYIKKYSSKFYSGYNINISSARYYKTR